VAAWRLALAAVSAVGEMLAASGVAKSSVAAGGWLYQSAA